MSCPSVDFPLGRVAKQDHFSLCRIVYTTDVEKTTSNRGIASFQGRALDRGILSDATSYNPPVRVTSSATLRFPFCSFQKDSSTAIRGTIVAVAADRQGIGSSSCRNSCVRENYTFRRPHLPTKPAPQDLPHVEYIDSTVPKLPLCLLPHCIPE